MADYGVAISLSQAHNSDDESSDHSPRNVPKLSAGGDSGSKSETRSQYQTPSSSDNNTRKPRGRPPGSKNKPKPPIVITRDSTSTMKPVILEISAGSDIIDVIISFARTNNVGVSIISATGSVSSVTLCHPVSHSPLISLHGPFGLLSLSGSFIESTTLSSNKTNQSSSTSTSPSICSYLSSSGSFGITLAGAQGQMFGGLVGGKVMAATPVIVVAATFVNPEFQMLPCEGDNKDIHHQEMKSCVHGNVAGGGGANELSVYVAASPTPINYQTSPDVMPNWDPSSRPY